MSERLETGLWAAVRPAAHPGMLRGRIEAPVRMKHETFPIHTVQPPSARRRMEAPAAPKVLCETSGAAVVRCAEARMR